MDYKYRRFKNNIVGITGKIGSGKDTVADYLVETLGFTKKPFAYYLKKKAMDDFDLTEADVYDPIKKEIVIEEYNKSPREILQLMGTEWYRNIDPNYWVKSLYRGLKDFAFYRTDGICISDVRFPNEAKFVQDIGGINIRIIRPEHNQTIHTTHASETALDDFDIPVIIVNDGTLEDLYSKVEQVAINLFPSIRNANY